MTNIAIETIEAVSVEEKLLLWYRVGSVSRNQRLRVALIWSRVVQRFGDLCG
jgi:hypothetical protein